MKALCWQGKQNVKVAHVPDPKIINNHDAIIKVTSTAICGSDLHLLSGVMPNMHKGDILGHEFMGEVVEIGAEVKNLKIGDRVVVPFIIACGQCSYCLQELYAFCEYSNPNAEIARKLLGMSPAGIFGYSHLLGGYSGGQAEYVRVPYADVGPLKIPAGVPDEQVLFLSDILPTGYMAAENCNIQRGDTVAIWGCGPVGQFAIQSAWMLGASRVIAIDYVPERLKLAESLGKAEVINFKEECVYDALMVMTKGKGPQCCIDAVGCEAHVGPTFDSYLDKIKQAVFLPIDRAHVLREAILCCAKGGTFSVPGVYISAVDSFPFGIAMNKGLTFKMGQTHVQKYMKPLLKKIIEGEINPAAIITHRIALDDADIAYNTFAAKNDNCIKVVMTM